jgi:hypothetical protein
MTTRLAVAAILALLAGCGGGSSTTSQPGFDQGWTKLPLPPRVNAQASTVWTGSELVTWGSGCAEAGRTGSCEPTTEGYVLRPGGSRWRATPPAPVSGAGARGVWTGSEAVFLLPRRLACCTGFRTVSQPTTGVAYDPDTRTWRVLPPAPVPIHEDGVQAWTGTEIVIWGGGGRHIEKVDPAVGAAYNPATDTWRRIAPAPLALNLASASWSGKEVLVFGSLLDGRNYAATRTAVGAAYDPATDSWRSIPPSALSAQATSAVWVGGRMLAWDYDTHWQTFDPETNTWGARRKMPINFNECYPETIAAGDRAFAFFCGQAAVYDAATRAWRRLSSGPLRTHTVRDIGFPVSRWNEAVQAPAGEGVVWELHSVTTAYWVYRP